MSATLDSLDAGHSGTVSSVTGDDWIRQRLLEMGVTPGVEVKLVRMAPFGAPLEVEVRGSRLSIDVDQAKRIALGATQPNGDATMRTPTSVPVATIKDRRARIALAGNPNTGKTTLFNSLTGLSGRVGNYPGITVDKRWGRCKLSETQQVDIIDIPGSYSLTATSHDEQLAIDELIGRLSSELPDIVVVLINATAPARGLYLLLQIQELGFPIVAALNMIDEAEAQGQHIDAAVLAREFSVPFVKMAAKKRRGLPELKATLAKSLSDAVEPTGDDDSETWAWEPSPSLTASLSRLATPVSETWPSATQSAPARSQALALWSLLSLRQDNELVGLPGPLKEAVSQEQQTLAQQNVDLALTVSQSRYQAIDAALGKAYHVGERKQRWSDGADALLTHPLWGLLTFITVMGLLFTALFDWAAPLSDLIDAGAGWASGAIKGIAGDALWGEFVSDGVITGVGSVVVFVPQIAILFLALGILEGSGYLARAAFMIDRLMRKLGLPGHAFVPLISGYACAIPAVMATRTMKRQRDRILTMMAVPLVSCSARLPIYTLVIATLFPANKTFFGPISVGTAMMMALYALSMVMALIAAAILGRTVLKGRRAPMLLELPPYRLPALGTLARSVWSKAWLFIKAAGTVILIASIILWALLSFPRDDARESALTRAQAAATAAGKANEAEAIGKRLRAERLRHSFAGRIGQAIEPALTPLGFDWKIGIGIIGSFAAREVFVATMGLVYATGDADENSKALRRAIRAERRPDGSPTYTPLVGLALLVFFMLAMQCVSTLGVVKQETGSWRWPILLLVYMTTLAYLATLAIYQGGRALGFS